MDHSMMVLVLVGLGLLASPPAGPSPAELVVCHLRQALSLAAERSCPCGEVCDEDATDADVEDRDVEDRDVEDGCDPADEDDEDREGDDD